MSSVAPILSSALLGMLPKSLREELVGAYTEILRNYRENRWEPAELNAGKLCEIVHSILAGYVAGSYPAKATKPANMVDACRALEKAPNSFSRSVRIQIPRMLIAVYEVRNNRGVGHVGGDVDSNHMDATCVVEMSKWILSELVRIFHNVTTAEATSAVDALVERTMPLVWRVGDKMRVLSTSMPMKDKVLVLLYQQSAAATEADIFKWAEHSKASVFRRDVLRQLHKAKLIEFDEGERMLTISPLGIKRVEEQLLK